MMRWPTYPGVWGNNKDSAVPGVKIEQAPDWLFTLLEGLKMSSEKVNMTWQQSNCGGTYGGICSKASSIFPQIILLAA